jgi:photosystem II stability/assembly factor-like uncharacterized protein
MEVQKVSTVRRDLGRQKAPGRSNWYRVRVLIVLACANWGLERNGHAQAPLEPSRAAAHDSHSWRPIGMGGGGAMFAPAISAADPKRILLRCDMSGAYRSADGGKNWEMIHYTQLADSTKVAPQWHPTDPNVAFAAHGSRGHLRKTRDGGKTWTTLEGAPSQVSAIGIDPGEPGLILVGGASAIFRSIDGGKTWVEMTRVRGRVIGFHFDQTGPTENRIVFAATDQTIFRSDDHGATWRDIGAPLAASPLLSFAAGSDKKSQTCIFYCSVGSAGSVEANRNKSGIYRSLDRGTTWTLITKEEMNARGNQRKGAPQRSITYDFVLTTDANPARVYACCGRDARVLRSDDQGATWRKILFQDRNSPEFNVGPNYLIDEPGLGDDPITGFGINPLVPDHLVVSDWMSVFITHDGGKKWESANTRSAETPGRRGTGMRWENTGLVVTTAWHYYLDPFEPNRHYIAYTDIGYARSTDAGKSWYWKTGRPLRNTTYELAFDPETPGTMWAAFADLHDIPFANVISGRHYRARASGGIGLSTDFGVTWRDSSQGLAKKPITSVVLDPKSPKSSRTLYASAFEDGVYKSTDGGTKWEKTSNRLGAPGVNMRACRIILHHDGTLFCLITALRKDGHYVAEGTGLYRSTDGAKTWSWINRSKPLHWPMDFDVDPRDSRVIYMGAADTESTEGGLYTTSDGGTTWARLARKGDQCFGATVNPHKPDWIYMCLGEGDESGPGLWLSKDRGKSWKALEGLPFRGAQRVSFDPKDDSVIYVCTFGGSVWRGPAD